MKITLPFLNLFPLMCRQERKKIGFLAGIVRSLFVIYCLGISNPGIQAQVVGPIKVNESNARWYRDSLNKKIFGPGGFPYTLLPDAVVTNVNDIEYYNGFPYGSIIYPAGNLDSIDKIEVSFDNNLVDFPERSKVYLFHPHNNNGKLFIYHAGHCAGSATAEDIIGNNDGAEPGGVIPALIAEGYTVLAVPMVHYQAAPPVGLVCGYNNHDPLIQNGNYPYPLSFFFKPLIASLNWLDRSGFTAIYMTGLSGGGWTTSVYPAMDSSISISFPVSGSWPLGIRMDLRDSEQGYLPVFGELLDYHELYTLACLAPPRRMLQINSRFDACCYTGSTAHVYYADSVSKVLANTGGAYKFYLDESHLSHKISSRALQVITKFISDETGILQQLPMDTVMNGAHYLYNIASNFAGSPVPLTLPVTYSLLKAPLWISLDTATGILEGDVPFGSIINASDTISFKAEDSVGRFIIYNYQLKKKRESPYMFTMFGIDSIVYLLPGYSNSLNAIDPSIASSFYFNNPSLSVIDVGISNNSVIRLALNLPLQVNDSIGYNGQSALSPILYNNGDMVENFDLTYVQLNGVVETTAAAGMIRFNSETGKFEFFNGMQWIDMN
jgi:hypothetical protein